MNAERRRYARLYARKQRARVLARVRSQQVNGKCPRKSGRYPCGGQLVPSVSRAGLLEYTCHRCDRREAGLCQDCPRPVEGRVRSALRCHACKRRVLNASTARYVARNLKLVRTKAREFARRNRVAGMAYKKLWRAANPEKVKAQKRREALRQNPKTLAWHKRWSSRVVRWNPPHESRRSGAAP